MEGRKFHFHECAIRCIFHQNRKVKRKRIVRKRKSVKKLFAAEFGTNVDCFIFRSTYHHYFANKNLLFRRKNTTQKCLATLPHSWFSNRYRQFCIRNWNSFSFLGRTYALGTFKTCAAACCIWSFFFGRGPFIWKWLPESVKKFLLYFITVQ